MTYKTLLVHVDHRPRRRQTLDLAVRLAERFDAHLVGLFALDAATVPSYALAESVALTQELAAKERAEIARAAQAEFRDAERMVRADWRLSTDDAAAAVTERARYADLVVLGQAEPGDTPARRVAETVLLAAGRPVLVVPYAGRFADTGKRVLVAWNASREAARAVADAMPLLAAAEAVEVAAFTESGVNEIPAADIAHYLARHGVKVTAARHGAAGQEIGAQLLSRAADRDADLIVMGGYGHTRLRELTLGGATRSILGAMTVPVLMSH